MSDPNILLMQYIEVIKRQLREQMSEQVGIKERTKEDIICLLYTSPSPRD